jgi:hypothetical protein
MLSDIQQQHFSHRQSAHITLMGQFSDATCLPRAIVSCNCQGLNKVKAISMRVRRGRRIFLLIWVAEFAFEKVKLESFMGNGKLGFWAIWLISISNKKGVFSVGDSSHCMDLKDQVFPVLLQRRGRSFVWLCWNRITVEIAPKLTLKHHLSSSFFKTIL